MKPIFYVAVDDVITDFVIANTPLREICKRFPLYLLSSGEDTGVFRRRYQKGTVIKCKENDFQLKGQQFFNYLQKNKIDCDCVVRLDVDAVVFDIDWLLRILKLNLMREKLGFIGNLVDRGKDRVYIRGACQAITYKLADKLSLQPTGKSDEYDYMFTVAAEEAGCKYIPYNLFEVTRVYTYTVPVWHPPKSALPERLAYFKRHIKKYKRYKKYRKR